MDQISRKTGNVAAYPLKLDLQLFAEEEAAPNLEDSPEFAADAREFNAKMDKFMESRTQEPEMKTEPDKVDTVEKPEVVEPEKPKQDSETNKAFQEMRKQLEAEKQRAADLEAKAQQDKQRADALIAQQFGDRGIFTVEQYELAVAREREIADNERFEQAGLTPDEVRKLREFDELQNRIQGDKVSQSQQQVQSAWNQLYSAYPDLVDTSKAFDAGGVPDWFTPEMKAEIDRGASPLAAYRHAHFDKLLNGKLQNEREAAKQEALDKLNSKEHLAPNATTGGEVDHVEIDEETMRAYRALNKGKTDAQIRAWHKKYANN